MKISEKPVGGEWVWFEDYVFVWADWTVNCPSDRVCEVGMGVMIFDKPRGQNLKFSPWREFRTFGAGAIHVRSIDGKGECIVRLDRGNVGLIPIYDGPAP